MSNFAIEIKELSKCYRIGLKEQLHDTLGGAIVSLFSQPFNNLKKLRKLTNFSIEDKNGEDIIWALKDITLEINHGEVVGLIGRNGAGKTTLLKILSRITEPTAGRIVINGRVSSLLEVGTGFHNELTGRENVYLNGSILGMSKKEITQKFDEIVSFAGVEKFIDTPVKRYSSGMNVRLAFAVAAHLEPEILLIDEVLAVGDAEFQKKCIGKMGEVASEGRTVLFVSHNMIAVKTLCERVIVIDEGKIRYNGLAHQAVNYYLDNDLIGKNEIVWNVETSPPQNENIIMRSIKIVPAEGSVLNIDSGIRLDITFENLREGINLDCTIYVLTIDDFMIFETGCIITKNKDSRIGIYTVYGNIPPFLLNAGSYKINLVFGENQKYVLFRINDVIGFELQNTITGRGSNMNVTPGVIRPLINWNYQYKATI